jgi:deoxyhypusine synthase
MSSSQPAGTFSRSHETLGRFHYLGDPKTDDAQLQEQSVDRIYDTLASEEEFREANEWIGGFASQLDHSHPYSTREFLHLLGRELSEIATEDGILTSAFKSRVPIFCPAITEVPSGRRHQQDREKIRSVDYPDGLDQIVAKSRSPA